MIVDVTAECLFDDLRRHLCDVITLAHVVEEIHLDHHVVDAELAGLQDADRVVARVEMEEVDLDRLQEVIAEFEAEDVAIERHKIIEPLGGDHDMTHAERAGAEAGNAAPGLERLGRGLRTMKHFEPVAGRIGEYDEIGDAAFVGECAGPARDLHPMAIEMRRKGFERGRVVDLEAEEAGAFAAVGIDDEALLAVIHAQGQAGAGLVDKLHAEQPRRVLLPVRKVCGAHTDVSE